MPSAFERIAANGATLPPALYDWVPTVAKATERYRALITMTLRVMLRLKSRSGFLNSSATLDTFSYPRYDQKIKADAMPIGISPFGKNGVKFSSRTSGTDAI